HFDKESAYHTLTSHFKTDGLAGYGVESMDLAVRAAGALLRYVQGTQEHALKHIHKLTTDDSSEYVVLDSVTRKNLELTQTIEGSNSPTLFSTLNNCASTM